MKPFKTFGSTVLAISSVVLISSCTKTLNEQVNSNSRSVSKKNGSPIPCGTAIELQMRQGTANNFFWVGNRNDVSARQEFSGTNFTDNQYFDVTSNVGMPYHQMSNGAMGVMNGANPNDRPWALDAGEELRFTLSAAMAGNLMSGFDIILHGNSSTVGSIELWKGSELIKTLAVANGSAASQNFGISYQSPYSLLPAEGNFFDQIRFKCSGGRYHILGFQRNNAIPPLLPPGRFYLASTGNAVYMRNQNSAAGTWMGRPNHFINKGLFPTGEGGAANYPNRQYRNSDVALGTMGSGFYNQVNPDRWLKISSEVFIDFRLGISDRYIDAGEEIFIVPGNDFPASKFGAIEIREAIVPALEGSNRGLDVLLYDGGSLVWSGKTSGIDQTYNFFSPPVPFDSVVVRGNSGTTGISSIGRASNQVISAYPTCN